MFTLPVLGRKAAAIGGLLSGCRTKTAEDKQMSIDVNNLGTRGLEILKGIGRSYEQEGMSVRETAAETPRGLTEQGARVVDSFEVSGGSQHHDFAQMIRRGREMANQYGGKR
jgi:hypothetical protein